MRGVSGSGKSTRAKELRKEWVKSCISNWCPEGVEEEDVLEAQTIICSADDFFVDHSSGEYNWDPKKLGAAHSWCKTRAETAMELGIGWVCIDNTNTAKWEYEPYLEMAKRFDYEVEVVKVGQLDESNLKVYANRNKHGVSLDVIRKQAKRFQ